MTPEPAAGGVALDADLVARITAHLEVLYPPEQVAETLPRLLAVVERFAREHPELATSLRPEPFDERDVVLITYADQVREPDRAPLDTLREFLSERVGGVINTVHLLPFYPWTSDDGFAVVDYEQVDPALGDWDAVERFADSFRLMVDAVFNHVSSRSPWFLGWLRNDPAYRDFFITVPEGTDVSCVMRPRPQPLLTEVEAVDGPRLVWTTFSADQVDLNYANPNVLVEMTRILLDYVGHGAALVRLDAVAYLWKRLETSCIHLPETHEIVRLWRTILSAVAPDVALITETNVPHEENVSYFGDGTDEAHLVYQFPLAPLVLSAFHLADTRPLQEWAAGLRTPSPTTAFLNFLGSHDGIGLRPVEGLLTRAEIAQLCDLAKAHGGGVSYKVNADGTFSPYEINAVYFDALTEADSPEPPSRQVDRFLASQSILLALAGVPAIYVQALLGSRNWLEGVEQTGRLRSINRRKFQRAELEAELDDPRSLRHQVFTRLRERIAVRIAEPAFHPNGEQRILSLDPRLFAFERTAPDGSSRVLCLHNVAGRAYRVVARPEDGLRVRGRLVDLVSGDTVSTSASGVLECAIPPYGVRWLRAD